MGDFDSTWEEFDQFYDNGGAEESNLLRNFDYKTLVHNLTLKAGKDKFKQLLKNFK